MLRGLTKVDINSRSEESGLCGCSGLTVAYQSFADCGDKFAGVPVDPERSVGLRKRRHPLIVWMWYSNGTPSASASNGTVL